MTRRGFRASWGLALVLALGTIRASANDGGAAPVAPENDPLEARDLAGLEEDARAIRAAAVAASRRPPDPIEGEVLTARPGTRELGYDVSIAFAGATADLRFVALIGNRGEHPSEVRWTLPLPAPFVITETNACVSEGARCAARDARVEVRPGSLSITFENLPPGSDARISVRAFVPVSMRGGVARVVLPPRRGDVRVGAASVRVVGDGPASIDGTLFSGAPIEVEAPRPIDARTTARTTGTTSTTVVEGPCGSSRCAVLQVVALPLATTTRTTSFLIVVDASRSTEGEARNRQLAVLDALQSIAPDAQVRIAAFGEDARLSTEAPLAFASVPRSVLVDACSSPLGSTTRPDRALARVTPLSGETVLLLGDGGFTPSREADEVARHLARARVEVRYLDVSTKGPRRELSRFLELARARTISFGAEADEAVRTGSMSRLREAVGEATDRSPDVVVRLRARNGTTSERRVARGSSLLVVAAAGLRASVGGRPVPRVDAAVTARSDDGRLLALAGAIASAEPGSSPASQAESIPREIVQTMVRTQVIPKARGCLRDDRRGRARYSIRAELSFRFAEREVTDAEVAGTLDPPLRACLLEALSRLEVPRFEGAIRVRYPIRTLEAEEPPTYELDRDVRERVDTIGTPLPATAGGVLEPGTRH